MLERRVEILCGHSTGHGLILHLVMKHLLLLVEILDHFFLFLFRFFGDILFLSFLRGVGFETELTFLLLRVQERRTRAAVHFYYNNIP